MPRVRRHHDHTHHRHPRTRHRRDRRPRHLGLLTVGAVPGAVLRARYGWTAEIVPTLRWPDRMSDDDLAAQAAGSRTPSARHSRQPDRRRSGRDRRRPHRCRPQRCARPARRSPATFVGRTLAPDPPADASRTRCLARQLATALSDPTVRLVLASASAGRLATLRRAGLEPQVIVSGVDEELDDPDPARHTLTLAERKADAVIDRPERELRPRRASSVSSSAATRCSSSTARSTASRPMPPRRPPAGGACAGEAACCTPGTA